MYYLSESKAGQWNLVEKISEFQGLSTGYCVKVLRALIRAGFVESRGRGYRLRKGLDDISAWDLMESFISDFNGAPEIRKNRLSLNLHRTLFEAANHWLVGLTVQDIVEMTKNENSRGIKAPQAKGRDILPVL